MEVLQAIERQKKQEKQREVATSAMHTAIGAPASLARPRCPKEEEAEWRQEKLEEDLCKGYLEGDW
eukprot:6096016-Alexandrium_andersonii.AAC.1